MLESMRITSFMGEVDISSKELILLVAIKGEVVDNVAFSLDLGLRKETGKRPIVTARFFPTLEKPLPVFELMSSLNSISVRDSAHFFLRFPSLRIFFVQHKMF